MKIKFRNLPLIFFVTIGIPSVWDTTKYRTTLLNSNSICDADMRNLNILHEIGLVNVAEKRNQLQNTRSVLERRQYTMSAGDPGVTYTSSSSTNTANVSTSMPSDVSSTQSVPTQTAAFDDPNIIIDPRTPPGKAVFSSPIQKSNTMTTDWSGNIIPAGGRLNITWTYASVKVYPRIVTLQYSLPISISHDSSKKWQNLAVNISGQTTQVFWDVPGDMPESSGYVIRIFDSNLGPGTMKAGRLAESYSGQFVIYKQADLGNMSPLSDDVNPRGVGCAVWFIVGLTALILT